MSPRKFNFSLAWDEDEGEIEASGPGDAEFLTTLNPNAHISLLKHIHIPTTHLHKVTAEVREIVKQMVPFQVAISTAVQQSGSRSVLFLKVGNTASSCSLATLTDLRSEILKIFDEPGKSWSDDDQLIYHPHLTVRRYCNPDNIKAEARKCSNAIKEHVGPFRAGQLGLTIRGITLFRDTRLGPRAVSHFPFGGYNLVCIARSPGHMLDPVSVSGSKTVVRAEKESRSRDLDQSWRRNGSGVQGAPWGRARPADTLFSILISSGSFFFVAYRCFVALLGQQDSSMCGKRLRDWEWDAD
ncbi:hypothetical protein K438DRAFT_2064057 [Mycena galopus ATCC 62051]|nr:hypothetical protein K438DRAFT_2064057 [Mycena galopus ATCC 62051]